LTAYKKLGLQDDWQVIQSYIFLLDLAGQFLTPLQLIEIALRNKMRSAIAKQTKKPDWYLTVPGSADSKRQVASVWPSPNLTGTFDSGDVTIESIAEQIARVTACAICCAA
jgi:hypothetical protein